MATGTVPRGRVEDVETNPSKQCSSGRLAFHTADAGSGRGAVEVLRLGKGCRLRFDQRVAMLQLQHEARDSWPRCLPR